MSILNPPFRSSIYYSVQNEDYETELAVLRHIYSGKPLRILLIASSGECALSLLSHDMVGQLVGVDISAAQLHLSELRLAASELLTRDEQLQLLGADPELVGAAGATARLTLYERIRHNMSASARAFWDDCRERDIAFGVQHVGRNDLFNHDLQDRLRQAGFQPLDHPVADTDLPAWKRVYADLMTPSYMLDLFGLPSEALAARIAGIAERLGECHFRALQQPHAERNPFLTTVFRNSYATAAGEEGLPMYLQSHGQSGLRRLGARERLHLRQGNAVEQMPLLAGELGLFDLISISNIADWMSDAAFTALVLQARDCLTAGGALLSRTATGSSMIVDITAQHMRTEAALSSRLPQIERGPWFRTLAVGFKI